MPANYRGAFACDDDALTRAWYVGAYTTRVTFVSNASSGEAYLGSEVRVHPKETNRIDRAYRRALAWHASHTHE